MVVWSKTEEMCDRFIKNVVLNRMLFDQSFIHESCFFKQALAFMYGGFFWSMLRMCEERFIFDQTLALMNRCVFIPFFHLWRIFYQTLHLWNDASCFWWNVAFMKRCTLIWSKIAFVNKALVWWAATQLNNRCLFLMDACI